jgi:NitT/TauT family transport system ATP-binding protein
MAGMTEDEPFISLRNGRKVYSAGGFLAVSDATMDVQEGELVALVGFPCRLLQSNPDAPILE